MKIPFILSPFSENQQISEFIGHISLNSAEIEICYEVSGDFEDYIIEKDQVEVAHREDRLWHKSCFELFITPWGGIKKDYIEINLSPIGNYQTFYFDNYRKGQRVFEEVEKESSDIVMTKQKLIFNSKLILKQHDFWKNSAFNIGVCAVFQKKDKRNFDYFALTHSKDEPDFHASECYSLYIKNDLKRNS